MQASHDHDLGILQPLRQWFRSAGIELNDSLLQIDLMQPSSSVSGAYCVRAIKDVSEGDQLGVIPKAACLSIRTTSAADIIENERLRGGLGLIFAVMHEHSLGESSFW